MPRGRRISAFGVEGGFDVVFGVVPAEPFAEDSGGDGEHLAAAVQTTGRCPGFLSSESSSVLHSEPNSTRCVLSSPNSASVSPR